MADLHIRHLSHGFVTRSAYTEAISNIELRIEEGEFFCLLGPSGCGKSTLLNVIAGFESPTKGQVEIDGQVMRGPGNDRVVVFQDVHNSLFPWMTVSDNVEFGLKMLGLSRTARKQRVRDLLRLVGLEGHEVKFPDELSGGMKQRVQIARALAIDPKILLMDEPFGALDAQTRRGLQIELLRIWEQTRKSVFFITHDIFEAVLLATRIGIMSKGPGATLARVLTIEAPRPRILTNSQTGELIERIQEMMGMEREHVRH
jgi:NitT/TauT family transport system ATP-binding protein